MPQPIRVDPKELRASAERMSALAEKLAGMEDQALSSGANAPSYDGQFGPKVNALGTETAGQMHTTISRLKASASQLQAIAQLFEDADAETLEAIQGIGGQLVSPHSGTTPE